MLGPSRKNTVSNADLFHWSSYDWLCPGNYLAAFSLRLIDWLETFSNPFADVRYLIVSTSVISSMFDQNASYFEVEPISLRIVRTIQHNGCLCHISFAKSPSRNRRRTLRTVTNLGILQLESLLQTNRLALYSHEHSVSNRDSPLPVSFLEPLASTFDTAAPENDRSRPSHTRQKDSYAHGEMS